MTNIKKMFTLSGWYAVGVLLLVSMVIFSVFPFVANAATLTRQLDFGMTGADISSLQTFLATDSNVYPSGLVTGYFGPLTQSAVQRFQVKNGIVSSGTPATTGYGRVGPQTLAVINAQMGGGTGVVSNNKTAPSIGNITTSVSSTAATLSWFTNENASAVLYYSTSPIPMTEGSENRGVTIGGSSILVNTNLQASHSTTLSGLSPNTTYYYIAYVRDADGNESITWPSTFRTSN